MKQSAFSGNLRSVRQADTVSKCQVNGESNPAACGAKSSGADHSSAGRSGGGFSDSQAKGLTRLVKQSIAEADRKGWVRV